MKTRRFLRFVWGFNGVALMIGLALGIAAAAYNIIADILRENSPAVIANVADDPDGKERWVLGPIQDVEGTEWLYVPLVSEQKDISLREAGMSKLQSSWDYYSSPARNLLFLNQRTQEMHWLFPSNKQIIANIETVSRAPKCEKARIVEVLLYRVISKDTNQDKKLSSEDLADIAASRPDGTALTTIAQSTERLFGTRFANADQFLVLHQSSGKGFVSVVGIGDLRVKTTREMPRSEKAP